MVQPSRLFANRCVCAVPSSVRMTTNNAQIFPGLAKLPGKTWLRLRSKQTQLLMNGSSNEYAWLAHDWMKRMSCFLFLSWAWYDWNSPLMLNDEYIGLYRDVWIAAIAWSRTRLATLTGAMCKTSQCELCSLRVNSWMLNVIRIVTYYTLPPLESPDSFWIAMGFSR